MNRLTTLALAVALGATSLATMAQTAAKPAAKAPAASSKATPAAASADPAPASPAQLAAAERVFYGTYVCDQDQKVQVSTLPKFPGYAELRFGSSVYVMKPVHSETGAIRLEDVKGETLVVQIAAKSMLLNVKTGKRLLDGCVSAQHNKA